jgi:hypothetical protein
MTFRTNSTLKGRLGYYIMKFTLIFIKGKEDDTYPIAEMVWKQGFKLKYGWSFDDY